MLCLWSLRLFLLACVLATLNAQPQPQDCAEYIDYVNQDNNWWDCVSHGDCTGMTCQVYSLQPDRVFLATASLTMDMCANPPRVNVFVDSPPTGIRNFSYAFYRIGFEQKRIDEGLSIHINNSISAQISRNSTHLNVWVNMVHGFMYSNTLFDIPNVPLLPGFCMCYSLQQVANDIHGPPIFSFEPSCALIETDSKCSGLRCSYADYVAEVLVHSCEEQLAITVSNSSGMDVFQQFSSFEFSRSYLVEINGTSGYIGIGNSYDIPNLDQEYGFTIGANYWTTNPRVEYSVLSYHNHSIILDKRCPVTPSSSTELPATELPATEQPGIETVTVVGAASPTRNSQSESAIMVSSFYEVSVESMFMNGTTALSASSLSGGTESEGLSLAGTEIQPKSKTEKTVMPSSFQAFLTAPVSSSTTLRVLTTRTSLTRAQSSQMSTRMQPSFATSTRGPSSQTASRGTPLSEILTSIEASLTRSANPVSQTNGRLYTSSSQTYVSLSATLLPSANHVSSTAASSSFSMPQFGSSSLKGFESSSPSPSKSSVSELTPSPGTSGQSHKLGLKIGVPVGVFLLVLVTVVIAVLTARCLSRHRKRTKDYSFQRISMKDL